jgi:AcrR family transcriptional regulator
MWHTVTMTPLETTKQRILYKSLDLFAQKGFLKVSMDELAASLSISKKTLYKSFSGKEKIVRAVFQWIGDESAAYISSIVNNNSIEFPEKIGRILVFMNHQLNRFGRFFFDDMKKSMPELWEEVLEFRRKRINENFGRIFDEAKDNGWFRNDVDPQLVLMIFLHCIQNMVTPESLATLPYTAPQVLDNIMKVIFEGVMTDNGRIRYNHILNNQTF